MTRWLTRFASSRALTRFGATNVPQITVLFWAIKVLTTGMGEAASDYLAAIDLVLGAGVGLVGLAVALGWQLRARTYEPARYWFAVSMVAVFGTMAADALHVFTGLSYVVTTIFWSVVVAVLFGCWRRVEGTLSIHSIRTLRREIFYWATVLATFALGTAAGDLTAIVLRLGYLDSAVLFAVAILLPLIGWRCGLASVPMFWAGYVLTRPLGASLADWFGKPAARGGLGLGDGPVAAAAVLVIIVLVVAVSRRQRSAVLEAGPT